MQSKHPIFAGGTFGLISGDNPHYHSEYGNHGHEALGNAMRQMGLHFEEVAGRYGGTPERSYIVHNPTLDQMKELGEQFGQESVIHSQNGIHRFVYTNGENAGKWHPAQMQTPIEHFEKPPADFYTHLPGHGYFRINFDFDKLHDGGLEKSYSIEEALALVLNLVRNYR